MTKKSLFLTLAIGLAGCSGTAGTEEERSSEIDTLSKITQMDPVTFTCSATKRSGSASQIKLRITGCTDLSDGVSVDLGSPFSGIYGYATKSAEVVIYQTNFNDLNSRLAGGAVSIILSVDSSGAVTKFCYSGTCVQ
jgi:hypothetical protein